MVVRHDDTKVVAGRVIQTRWERASPKQRHGKWFWREVGEEAWRGPFSHKSYAFNDAEKKREL